MNATLRRVFMFSAMVTTGVAAIWLLQEEQAPGRGDAFGSVEPSQDAVGLIDEDSDTQVEVTFGELYFDVPREVEISPGVVETRTAYRVHVRDTHPSPDGAAFLVSEPTITFLDLDTGAERGTLRAATGRFETEPSAGGKLRFDFGANLRADRFALTGDVHGEFPMADGGTAILDAESLRADGPLITAPGLVSWRREDMALVGVDMTWREADGILTYASDAEITFLELDGSGQAVVRSPGGLTWQLPEEGRTGRGWGELHGPITGEATDGSRIAADTLAIGADSGSLILRGSALVELPRGGRTWRITAAHMTVSQDEQGQLALAQADGGVRVEDVADAGTWMEAELITSHAGLYLAPGPVTFHHLGVTTTGKDLRWSEVDDRFELSSDAVIVGGEAAEALFVGARLASPRGLDWVLSDPGVTTDHGRLRGPVSGSLADGSELRCDVLEWDASARRATLDGQAYLRRHTDQGSDELSADRLELKLDEQGLVSAGLCTGKVRFAQTPPTGQGSLLTTERLEILGDLVIATGAVVLQHGRFGATSVGLRFDDASGRLDLARDASLTISDALGRELTLDSTLGVSWWLPEDRSLGADAGHGVLTGPVTGRTADGGRLRADRGVVRAGLTGLELIGGAEIRWPDVGHITSEQLDIRTSPEGLRATSNTHVEWTRGLMQGSGQGMQLDETAGSLAFDNDVELVFRDEDGGIRLAIACEGSLQWAAPPGSSDPLNEGRGEFRDGVAGRDASGGAFSTERLVIDGPSGLIEFHGRSHLEHVGLLATLDATDGIGIERDPEGNLRRLHATGSVVGRQRGTDLELELSADELVIDRPRHLMTLSGSARVARRDGDRTMSLETEPDGVIRAVTDEAQRLRNVDVEGRVTITSEQLRGLSDHLSWDVREDLVVLEGNCRFLSVGGWMEAPRVEIWPSAGRWHVPRSVIVLDDRP